MKRVTRNLRGDVSTGRAPDLWLEHVGAPPTWWAGWYATREGIAHVLAGDQQGERLGFVRLHTVKDGRVVQLAQDNLRGARNQRGLTRTAARFLRWVHGAQGPGANAREARDDGQQHLPLGFPPGWSEVEPAAGEPQPLPGGRALQLEVREVVRVQDQVHVAPGPTRT